MAWRDLHEHFGKWSSFYRQFRRWTLSGLWELLLEAFNESGGGNPSLQMIDSPIIPAHHCSAGANSKSNGSDCAGAETILRIPSAHFIGDSQVLWHTGNKFPANAGSRFWSWGSGSCLRNQPDKPESGVTLRAGDTG